MKALVEEQVPRATADVEIRSGPLQGGGAFVRDYLNGTPALAPFYATHPGDLDAYLRKATEVDARLDGAARARLASAIEPLGDAADRLGRILAGDGYFVTTGQQPALFGGPLYTLYKVLGAIRLAEVLEPVLRRPVLALFWVGADDHDWAEANHAQLLDADAYARRLEVSAPADAPPLPLSDRTWGADIERVKTELAALLGAAPFAGEVMTHVAEAYRADATVEESFTSTMRLLLRDRRVAIISSAHPELRRAAAPVLRREAEHAEDHFRVLERQTQALAAAGYAPQVAIAADASNIMLLDAHGRDRLMHTARGWQTRREKQAVPADELLAQIDAHPQRFSPNVLLRPIVESAVLPTIAYVAGPGELRYFAQIGCLFRAHGIEPPVVVARPSALLLDARTRRLLNRLALQPDDFARPYQELATTIARREIPQETDATLQRIRDNLLSDYSALMDTVEDIDPTLRGPLTNLRNRSLLRAFDAEKRIIRHLKRKNAVLLEQLRKAAASLRPEGAPQERVLSVLPLLAWHGPGLVAQLESAFDMTPHRVAEWNTLRCSD